LTYDVDFDTQEERFEVICNALKEANKTLGGKRSLEDKNPGLITFQPGKNVKASFEGINRLAQFSRWITKEGRFLRLHIMNVPDMPAMSKGDGSKLETVLPINAIVPTASRKYLFYRKSLRANRETRVEDFLDLTFMITSSTKKQLSEVRDYCSEPAKKSIVETGLKNLILKNKEFTSEVETRLGHARPSTSTEAWVEEAAIILDEFVKSLR